MEVSTQSNNSGPFGCFSNHQGVSYEDDPFLHGQTYGKRFKSSADCSSSTSKSTSSSLHSNDMGIDVQGGVVEDMHYESCSSVSVEDDDCWSDEDDLSLAEEESDHSSEYSNPILPPSESNKKSRVAVLSASTEMLRIRFPFLSISIRLSDFFCLQERELLNDTIVDFYLNHIVEHLMPDDCDRRITVLPAVFWHNLSILQSSLPESYETLSPSEQLDSRFSDVFDFVEDFELFDVDYIVIPINEWEHWSVAIVCNPFTDRGRTVCFDSLIRDDPNDLRSSCSVINEFLQYSWMRRFEGGRQMSPLKCVVPSNMHQQSNNVDCGLFVLEFAQKFLLNPPQQLNDELDLSALYPTFSVTGKRKAIQSTILNFTANRNLWLPLLELLETRESKQQQQQQQQ